MPIAEILTQKKDWKLAITLDYDLILKDEFEPKAKGLYKKYGKEYPEPFVTWEIRVNNHEELRKYVRRHNHYQLIDYDGEENAPIHIQQVDDYQIICLPISQQTNLLKTKEKAERLMKEWLIYVIALAHDKEFYDVNQYIKAHNAGELPDMVLLGKERQQKNI
jgi:hypothetical protein